MKHLLIYIKKLREFAGFKLYVNLIGMTVISFLEGIGIFLLVPALGLIGIFHMDTSGIPFVSYLVGPLQAIPEGMRLPVLLGGFILLIAGQALMQRKQTNLNLEIQHGFIRYLRVEIYQGLLQANWAFFLRNRRSDFTHVMTNELLRVSMSTYLALRLTTTLLFTAVQIGFALWLSVKLTAMVLICGLAVAVYSSKFIKRSKTIGDQTSELAQNYIGGITDHFNGMKDIKSNMTEAQHLTWFRVLCGQMEDNLVQFGKTQSASQYVYKVASVILIALFVFLSLEVFHVPAEKLVLIIVIFPGCGRSFRPCRPIGSRSPSRCPPSRALRIFKGNAGWPRSRILSTSRPDENLCAWGKELNAASINYRYDGSGSSYALHDISLSIPG